MVDKNYPYDMMKTMDKISQEQAEVIQEEVVFTETWVKMHLERGSLGKQLILAVLNDLRIQVETGEVPDYFGM